MLNTNRWPMTRQYFTIVALMLGLLLVFCSHGAVPPMADAELEIRVVRGPINPTVREGEDNYVGVPGATVTIRPLQGRGVTQARMGSEGSIVVRVPSGDVLVSVADCPAGTLSAKEQHVRSVANDRVVITLICDTGIR